MSRREWTFTGTCGHEGCNERFTYRYPTRRDLVESFEVKNYSNGRWRCMRHNRPNEVLSAANPTTTHELLVEERPYGRYFGHQGAIFGPGFKAFADDFPAGAKIIVTAQLVLPEDTRP